MATISPDWKVYKYKVAQCALYIDSETIKIDSGKIQNFFIEKDFDSDNLPIFMIRLLLSSEIYYKICKAQDSAQLGLDIKSVVDRGEEQLEEFSDYIKGKFVLLPVDNTPFMNEEIMRETKEAGSYGKGGTDITDMANGYSFILAKYETLNSTKVIVNSVLQSANILTTVAYALSSAGCSNILMAAPDNTITYKEMLLLPIPLINQLKYLNNYYGLYKSGAQIFFDFDRIYIVKKCSNSGAFDDVEPKMVGFHVYDGSNGTDYGCGSYTDNLNKKGYITVGADQFDVKDLSTTSTQYSGNNSIIVNNSGTSSVANTDNTKGNSKSFNVITTSTHNPYATQETKLRLDELKSVITITTSNCDLKLLTPNRCYRISSTSTKAAMAVNNTYRLSKLTVMFIKDGDLFTNDTQITLKKSDAS